MAYTTKQMAAMAEARAAVAAKDRRGHLNLVATVQGSKGDEYIIREAAPGTQGEMRLYCSCPAQKFHAGFGALCKHGKALLRSARVMIDAGQDRMAGVRVYDPEAIERAMKVRWAMDAAFTSAKSDSGAYRARKAR